MDEAKMATIFEDNFITSSDMLEDEVEDSPIKNYLNDKTVFVSGGLGYLGKLLVEKLLHCGIKRIYLLVRAKKGQTIGERFETLKNEPIFKKLLKKQKGNPFSNVSLIQGDLKESELGISLDDQAKLVSEVEIVFHAAADVRFDENLKEATEINVRGTREMMFMSQKMKNLNVFIYVSTAFCTPSFEVTETFYETNLDPDFMIDFVEKLRPEDYDDFEVVARRLIQPYPNTYTYTKALAELIVRKYGNNLNTAIIRPAIIATVYLDPLPGYTDNIYGVNGVVAGAGVGILRILHINNLMKANIVPADFVANATIGLAWFTMLKNNFQLVKQQNIPTIDLTQSSKEDIKIYHCTVSNKNPVTWGDVKSQTTLIGDKNPMKQGIWIIRYNTTKYYYLSQFLKLFYHFLPALIIDAFLELNNKKPKLLKIYRKVNKFSEVLSFFTTNDWNFDDCNIKQLMDAMSQHDKKYFECNVDGIDWADFFRIFCAGLRKYACKESLDTLDDARRRYRLFTILHYLLMTVIYAVLTLLTFQVLKFYGFVDYGINLITHTKAAFITNDAL